MLSKTEREFLQGKYQTTISHKRFLNHKIKKKLKEFYQLELPLIENTSVSDYTNIASEFTNTSKNNLHKVENDLVKNKSLERDLNPRPNAYEAFALPG